MIEITSSDGHTFGAYRADPEGEPKGAVVVLQEIFGVNQHVRRITDGFAAQGYVAIAPALFDRFKKGLDLGYDEGALATGIEAMKQVGETGPLADIQAAVDAVKSAGKVAIVGYSWGGYLSYLSANQVQGIACAIGYYGLGVTSAAREKRRVPTLLHFGAKDHLIPREELVQFRALRPDVSVYSYEAGHGFNCEERDTYNEDAAIKARERTLFMISQYLEGQGPVKLKNAGAYISQESKKKKKPAAAANDGPPDF